MKDIIVNKKGIYLTFVLGIILIISGTIFSVSYFKHEVLDNKYYVTKVTEYKDKKRTLNKGEIIVTKNISYIKNGMYKIVYKNVFKQNDNKKLLEEDSKFLIVDVLGDEYVLLKDKIIVNKKTYSLNTTKLITPSFDIRYENNEFEISMPSKLASKKNTIEIYVKLVGRNPGKKYNVSKDSYYSLTPHKENNFYKKNNMHSYIIEGKCLIILKEK